MATKKSIYKVSEFAELYGWSEEVVRQKCRKQIDPRTNQAASLPEGFAAAKEGGEWFVYRTDAGDDGGLKSRSLQDRGVAAINLLGSLNWTDLSAGGREYRPPITWRQFISELFDPKASFLSDARRARQEPSRGGTVRLRNFIGLLNTIRAAVWLLSRHESVSLTVNIDRAGPMADWSVVLEAPLTEPLFYECGSDDPRVRALLTEWAYEIEQFRKEGGIPGQRWGLSESSDEEYLLICCECAQQVEGHQKYCSTLCRDRHYKWISKVAQQCSPEVQSSEIQKRVQKIVARKN